MNAAVFLSQKEKKVFCDAMTEHLVELRGRLGKTQEEMENASGISRVTLSQIESGRAEMSWIHFTSLMEMFSQSQECKELLFVRNILNDKLLAFFQCGPMEEKDFNVEVPEDRIYVLQKMKQDRTNDLEAEF